MVATSLLVYALAAAPQQPAAPLRVAAIRFHVVDVSAERAEFYTEHASDRLADQGLEVITSRQIAAMLGFERQKMLLGCNDESSSCIAELGNALGADALLMGDVARLADGFLLNLKVVGAQSGERIAAFSQKVPSEGALLEALTNAARPLADQVAQHLGRPLTPRATRPAAAVVASGGVRGVWWVPAAVGGAALVAGTVGLVVAENNRVALASGTFERTRADALLQSGQTARTLGWLGIGVGAAALGLGAGFLIFGGSSGVTPVAAFSPDSAMVGIAGRLP